MVTLALMFCCFLHLVRCQLPSANLTVNLEPEYLDLLLKTKQYEEFSKLTNIDVDLVRPSEGNLLFHPFLLKGQINGDMILTPWQKKQMRDGINLDRYPRNRWPNNRVPYAISSDFTEREKALIRDAYNDWNKNIKNVKIVERNREKDYVFIISGNGCYSNLGHTGGQQTLSLKRNGCLSKGTIVHEMMHAVGFRHEHTRLDRDEYVTVRYHDIPRDWHSQYEKDTPGEYKMVGEYDYNSVMHYPFNAPGTNKAAFEILQKNVHHSQLGQRNGMTMSDISKIEEYYS